MHHVVHNTDDDNNNDNKSNDDDNNDKVNSSSSNDVSIIMNIISLFMYFACLLFFLSDFQGSGLDEFLGGMLAGPLLHLKKIKIVCFIGMENGVTFEVWNGAKKKALIHDKLNFSHVPQLFVERCKEIQSFPRSSPKMEVLVEF